MATTPPGWYDDGHGALRWWDGTRWTEHAQPLPAPDAAPAASASTEVAAPIGDKPVVEEVEVVESLEQLEAATAAAPAQEQPAVPVGYPPVPPPPPGAQGAAPVTYPVTGGPGYPPSAYPGGHVGAPAQTGGFIAATEPKKSKTWIVWLVIGIVLLLLVAAAAVIIPLTLMISSSSGVGPSGEDETAAVATVELYDDAWSASDCDMFVAATTESFRENIGLATCEDFELASADFGSSVQGYEITVTDIAHEDGSIIVSTTEHYESLLDETGEPADVPIPLEDHYVYTLVESGSDWLIDGARTEE